MLTEGGSGHRLRNGTFLNGKYRIEKVLGEGGFGITYRAVDITLDLQVAVKEYYPAGCVTRETSVGNTVTAFTGEKQEIYNLGREKFINEARTLGKLTGQPGIVSVRDYFQENNTAYIVMEFLDGITLKDYLKQAGGRIPAEEALALIRPVVQSLAEVHRQGLIHRDISPDNIMIQTGNRVKLMDFGAARDVSLNGEKSLSVMLKPGYAPEEQYRTRGEQGPWSDIYALCGTVYRCITGQVPVEAMERVRKDTLPAPSAMGISMDREKEAALMKGLAVFSEDRIRSAGELYAAWYGAAEQATGTEAHQTAAEGITAAVTPRKPERKKGKLVPICLLAAAFVAAVVAAIFFLPKGAGKAAVTPGDLHYSSQIAAVEGKQLYLRQRDGLLAGQRDGLTGIAEPEELLTELQMGSILAPGDSYVYMVYPQGGLVRFAMGETNGAEYVTEVPVEDGFLISDQKIYYIKSETGCLYRAETGGGREKRLTRCEVEVNAFTLYGGELWYYAEEGADGRGIYVRDLSSGEEKIVKGSDSLGKVSCLRSGNGVIYVLTGKRELYTVMPDSRKLSDCYGSYGTGDEPVIPVETGALSGFLYRKDENTIAFFNYKEKKGSAIYSAESGQEILFFDCEKETVYFVTEDGCYHCFSLPENGKLTSAVVQKKLVDMDDGVNYFNQGGNGEGALPIRETDVSGGQKIYSRSVADYVQEAGVTLLMTEHALVYGLRLEDGSLDGVDALATWEADEEKLNAFAMDGDYVYLAYEDGLYRGDVVNGGGLEDITCNAAGAVSGFLIDGEKIYYKAVNKQSLSWAIYQSNRDGSDAKCLVERCYGEGSQPFDVSGRLLIYPEKQEDKRYAISALNMETGEISLFDLDLIRQLSGEDIPDESMITSIRIVGKELYFVCGADIFCIDFTDSAIRALTALNELSLSVTSELLVVDGGLLAAITEEFNGTLLYSVYYYDREKQDRSLVWTDSSLIVPGYADGFFYLYNAESGEYYCLGKSTRNFVSLNNVSYYGTYLLTE